MPITIETLNGIQVILNDNGKGITIASNLREFFEVPKNPTTIEQEQISSVIDALESFILALACAGVNISSSEFKEGLQTSVESIANHIL